MGSVSMKRRHFRLIIELGQMIRRRKVWFLVPLVSMLLFVIFMLVILESPALMPFFYAIF
jgi:hypothetical protein